MSFSVSPLQSLAAYYIPASAVAAASFTFSFHDEQSG
jgi:hypothetical protein